MKAIERFIKLFLQSDIISSLHIYAPKTTLHTLHTHIETEVLNE